MSRETIQSKKTRSKLMQELNIPINLRSSFIRFCRNGVGDIYDREAYFWNEEKLKFGQYAPIEDRSRVYKTIGEMWKIYQEYYKKNINYGKTGNNRTKNQRIKQIFNSK